MNLYLRKSLLFVWVFLICSPEIVLAKENSALNNKHQKIIQDFPAVKHVTATGLSQMKKDDVVIFDVREPGEYKVSHIEEAIWVSPKITTEEFLSKYSDQVNGKTVVLYCSVGHRSSVLAEKVQSGLNASGSQAVYNLEGGLFNWHNENKPLVTSGAKATDFIHPYNFYWGRMVNRKSKKRYKVEVKQ